MHNSTDNKLALSRHQVSATQMEQPKNNCQIILMRRCTLYQHSVRCHPQNKNWFD